MEFRCRLGTPSGEIVEGTYVAESEERLRRELEEKGLYVLALRRRAGLGSVTIGRRQGRVRRRDFLVFNQELATLLKAGMPLVQSLDILRQRVPDPAFKSVLDTVHDRVKGGTALSDAFAEHGAMFPAVYSASLLAGERSGSLDTVIRRYVSYEKLVGAVRSRTISALIYPAILVAVMTVLVGVIIVLVLPAFSDFYGDFDRELPVLTRVIIGVSDAILANAWLAGLLLVGVVVAGATWGRRSAQRLRFDRWILEAPVIGPTAAKFYTSQLARMLATLLGGGIPLVQALEIAARSVANRHLAAELDVVRLRVQEGQGFAAALRDRGIMADVAVKMVEVGESTGALQDMLNNLSDFYDEEIETEVSRAITLVEPALLVIMGIVIAVVVLGLYLPLFELSAVAGA
jgi:type IV pilus assembly protein PilC